MLSADRSAVGGGLAAAIADRRAAFLRAQERWLALETRPLRAGAEPDSERDLVEALLRRALLCLAGASEYALAHQLLGTGAVVASGPLAELSLQALAQAGLATWDPSSGELHPTALLEELMGLFESAVEGAVEDGGT
ncbi:MAG: hypothetical protein ACYCYK_02160 [Candidatus Dormibacteria bacterium]